MFVLQHLDDKLLGQNVIVIVLPVEALFRNLNIQSYSATPESARQIPA